MVKKLISIVFLEIFIYADIFIIDAMKLYIKRRFNPYPLAVYSIFANIIIGVLLFIICKQLSDNSEYNKWLSIALVIINVAALALIYIIEGRLTTLAPIVIGFMTLFAVYKFKK